MMISIDEAKIGLLSYITDEILPKLTGIQKVGVAVYVDLASNKIADIIRQYANNPYVSVLGVIENDKIDIDRLRNSILSHMGSERLSIQIPLVGELTLDRTDIDTLYNKMRAVR